MGMHASATLFIGAPVMSDGDHDPFENWRHDVDPEDFDEDIEDVDTSYFDWEDVYLKRRGFDKKNPWNRYEEPDNCNWQQRSAAEKEFKKGNREEIDAYYEERKNLLKEAECEVGSSGHYDDDENPLYVQFGGWHNQKYIGCGDIVQIKPEDLKITDEKRKKIQEFAEFMGLNIGKIGVYVEVSFG